MVLGAAVEAAGMLSAYRMRQRLGSLTGPRSVAAAMAAARAEQDHEDAPGPDPATLAAVTAAVSDRRADAVAGAAVAIRVTGATGNAAHAAADASLTPPQASKLSAAAREEPQRPPEAASAGAQVAALVGSSPRLKRPDAARQADAAVLQNAPSAAPAPRVRAFASAHAQLHAFGSAGDLASRTAGRSGALALAAAAEAAAAAAAARAQRLRAQAIRALGGASSGHAPSADAKRSTGLVGSSSAAVHPAMRSRSLDSVPEDVEGGATPESSSGSPNSPPQRSKVNAQAVSALESSQAAAAAVPLRLLHLATADAQIPVAGAPIVIAPSLFSPGPGGTAATATAVGAACVRVKVLVITVTGEELLMMQRQKLAALALCVGWARTRRRYAVAVRSFASGLMATAVRRHRAAARACSTFSLGEWHCDAVCVPVVSYCQ